MKHIPSHQNYSTTQESLNTFEYSPREIYFIIKNNIKLSASIFIVFFSLCFYITLILKPIYKSSSTIMVRQDQKSVNLFAMMDMGLTKDRNYIENEIEVLKSRTTLDAVIDRLYASQYRNNLYLFKTKDYNSSFIRKLLTIGIPDFIQDIQKPDFELTDSLRTIFRNRLKKSMEVLNRRNTDALTISIISNSPDEAALITNELVEVYKQRDLKWLTSEMGHLKLFLTEQLGKKEKELHDIEDKLKDFQEKEKIFGLEDNSKLNLENLTLFETQYNNVLAQIEINEQKIKYLSQLLTDDEKEFSQNVNNSINDRLLALKNELAITESEMISLQTQYGDNHSAIIPLNKKIATLKSKLNNETRDLISQGISVANPIVYRQTLMDSVISLQAAQGFLQSKAVPYKKLVDEYDEKLSSLPEKMLQYIRLERTRVIHTETFEFMSKKLEEARIGEASKLGKVRVIDYAIINNSPIAPNKTKNIFIGSFIGLILGILASFIKDHLDNTIKTIEQIEKKGLPILAMIPDLNNKQHSSKQLKVSSEEVFVDIEQFQRRLITHEDPKSPISEAYRSLRTSLMYTKESSNADCKVILVSSSGPGEGKTTTISNLAITYANLGKKTLLIDGDLRKSVAHKVFNLNRSPGVTSYLSGMNDDIDKIINKTDIDNLSILTSGVSPPNPSELLESSKMKEFLEIVRKKYDVILIDTPPLIAVADAYIIMKYVDEFVLIIRAGVTEKGAFERVYGTLSNSGFDITGVVMNAMTEEHHSYGAGYYYNNDAYYGDGSSES